MQTKRDSHSWSCLKHSEVVQTVSVSKVVSDRSIPLVENLPLGALTLGIQYETGCQLSLISKSVLETILNSMYSQGTSSRVRVLTYAGEGKVIFTTEVKLRLNGKLLKLSTIEKDLNMDLDSPSQPPPNGELSQEPRSPSTQARSPSC